MSGRAYPEVASALQPWFASRLDADSVVITEVRRHAEGFSWQTYTMTVQWDDRTTGRSRRQGFAIRREPEDGLLAPYDTGEQYELHRAVLDNSDVPMPDLYWLEMDRDVLGMPFYVMERVEGVVPVPWRGNDPDVFPDEEARRRLGLDFTDVMAEIHTIDWRSAELAKLLGGAEDAEEAARREIATWERFYEEGLLVEEPIVREALGWLRANLTTSGHLALVHADYRIGNFMVRDGRIVAVFDWELAHIGDPVFDIAYAGMPLYRGRDPRFSQLLHPDELIPRYEERTGIRVAPEVLRFWTVFGHVRAAAPHLRACRAFEEGRSDDVRLAAMGHQVLYILKSLARELNLR